MTLSRLVRIAQHRIRSLFRKDAIDGEVARELAFHFDLLVGENLAQGRTAADARYAARRSLGNVVVE